MARSEVKKFSETFQWGFAKIEGSPSAEGRLPSIWDTFSPNAGDHATNSYELWKDDIALLKSYGVKAYRFSLSWPRIIPKGSRQSEVNQAGINHYRQIIERLLNDGIRPFVTLDLPAELHKTYQGWLNKEEIVKDFVFYAETCFKAFGDLVKDWFVLHLASLNSVYYIAHWDNYQRALTYNDKFKQAQGGQIGITLNASWLMPFDDAPVNFAAAKRAMDVTLGWFADPIYKATYPPALKDMLGSRLPEFTPEEVNVLRNTSSDFFGLNTYTSHLVKEGGSEEFNGKVTYTFTRPDGTELGTQAQVPWLQTYAPGFRELLKYTWQTYHKPIHVTENGFAQKDENKKSIEEAIRDNDRVKYYTGYVNALLNASTMDNVDVRSYFAWSLLDNFEWADAYETRFGVTYVDYKTQKRYPKDSSAFLIKFFKEHIESSK
ncbi:hypothetical protein EW146_g997 [Bondarzewia mesenterica]|uniref:Beta-glucosidase n=1 Tax=Bondarzewia mesenterica TaxID=1095465 RepID=A0A4V3XG76_9AGAM|nr:hypothetical protein EW146_g997 [Bondarzewia mesenterica]